MSLQALINSPAGVSLALDLGRALPPRLGYPLARFLADRVAARTGSPMVQSVWANQQVVHGGRLSPAELAALSQATFRHTAHCLYDLYHNRQDIPAMQRLIQYTPAVEQLFERIRAGREGTLVVGVHMSNFDFVLQAAGLRGLRALTLAVAQPGSGYRWQNDLRRQAGVEIVPASPDTLRQAVRRLRAGGSVLTGVDRPVDAPRLQPRFFGLPARLPTHHIHLALLADVPLVVVAAIMRPDGCYEITASDTIDMERSLGGSRLSHQQEILHNAERVLQAAEELIRRAPYQWAMFFPVWDLTDVAASPASAGDS